MGISLRDQAHVQCKLLVGHQPDMTKREEGIKTKGLGGVKWVVSW